MNVKNGTELATGSLKPSRLKKTTFLVLYKSAIYGCVRTKNGLEILEKVYRTFFEGLIFIFRIFSLSHD